ncbi:hypothetical protein PHLGIDRAFT_234802 [Phlebiopsis gigantea 11061_1 CR5-6]|uniref:Uncharacterized protein n=1 Tax=Phlebiopsis gigantea (strain 11061_1 CR5-6) TaxID=745531 RepID=A0A0C3NFS2_PHLG1|nr:hypothetical protein PHLGIDRAFT_234802 [Phlebiopsis gigantea 11061_1 CR5-6]
MNQKGVPPTTSTHTRMPRRGLSAIPVAPTITVPRPGNLASFRGRRNIPGLTEYERDILKNSLPAILPLYLNLNAIWSDQELEGRASLIMDMVDKHPWLKRYEGAWPVEAAAMEWITNRRRQDGRSRQQRIQVASRNQPYHLRSRARARVEVVIQRPPPKPTRRKACLPHAMPDPAPPQPAPEAAQDCCKTPPATDAVRGFLASLQLPMGNFTPILVQGGVQEKESLEALISMTEEQQRSFLNRLPFTVFQVEVICNGLAQYQK